MIVDLIRTLPLSQVIELVKILVIFINSKSTKNIGNPNFATKCESDTPMLRENLKLREVQPAYTYSSHLLDTLALNIHV